MSQPWIVMMPEGWRPEDCGVKCKFANDDFECEKHKEDCPIAHAVPVKGVEPLAVLAARKGFAYIYTDGYHKRNKFEVTEISIFESITEGGSTSGEYCFHAQSYAEAESKARAYLEGLDDKGGR